DIIEKLYDFNHEPENNTIKDYAPGKRGQKSLHSWGGARTRQLLQAVYTLAFSCLLRFDEVLKIRMEHVTVVNDRLIKLMLCGVAILAGGGNGRFTSVTIVEVERAASV
ncbi:hypothetical protein H0H81_004909, partial [Sphagnurus paluster]